MARVPKSSVRVNSDLIPECMEAVRAAFQDFVPEIAAAVRDEAKASTEFKDKTGKLRKSIKDRHITAEKATSSNDEWIVQARAPHAHLVEFGHAQVTKEGKTTGFTPGHPFLEPSLEKVMSHIESYLPKGI